MGSKPSLHRREHDASHGAGIATAPGSFFMVPTAAWGTWGTTTIISYLPSQQKCWYLQPAQSPVLPVLLILVFARGGRCLGAAPAAPARGPAGMERDDRPHGGDSPGPFQASGSRWFSPGSGFSGSFGLSGASLDSAAGEGRQQVTHEEFQSQHPPGVRTTGPATPQGQDVCGFTLEDVHVHEGVPLEIPVSKTPLLPNWGGPSCPTG